MTVLYGTGEELWAQLWDGSKGWEELGELSYVISAAGTHIEVIVLRGCSEMKTDSD